MAGHPWLRRFRAHQSAPEGVFFEILNEPSRALTPTLWNQYLRQALAIIRESNPNRTVIVGPPFWNSIGHLEDLELPASDRRIIVTVHYYAPMESRVRYTDAVARTAESFGWSWAYWQFDSDFILYDIDRDAWVGPILEALVPATDHQLRSGHYPGSPFRGRVQSLPGLLECEWYDEGGEGVAYHDGDGRNHGSGELNRGDNDRDRFRERENVDISYTKDDWDNSDYNRVEQELGRFYLGWTAPGEWVRYTVDIAQAGLYTVGVMYTARYDGEVLLRCDERPTGPPIRLGSTADAGDARHNWHHWNYHLQKEAVSLPAGRHVLTLRVLDPGNLNLDRIDFSREH